MRSYVLFFTILPCRHEPALTSEALGWGLMFLPLYGEVIAFDKPPRSRLALASGSCPRITAGRSVGFFLSYVIGRYHGTRGRAHTAGPEEPGRKPGGEGDDSETDCEQEEPGQQYKRDRYHHDRKHDEHGSFPPVEPSRLPACPTMLELHTHLHEIGVKGRRRKNQAGSGHGQDEKLIFETLVK